MPAFQTVQLTTERLVLRQLRPEDADVLFAMFSDPGVMRYWSTPPWPDVAAAHEFLSRDGKGVAAGKHLRLGIERRDGHDLIGQCALFEFIHQCRRAEVGYSLARTAWGHGYMHEALTALMNYGFHELDLNRVEADIDPRNHASARSLERLGFHKEGLFRERWIVGGEVSDSAMYGLLRSDWLAASSSQDR